MLEFALASSFLFAAFGGTFQFGYTYYMYNRLETAVRSGARYASLRAYDSPTSTPSSAFSTSVKNVVVYGNSGGTGSPLATGLTAAKVSVLPTMTGKVPDSITVNISNYTLDAIFSSFTFNGKPSVTFPYAGVPQPD